MTKRSRILLATLWCCVHVASSQIQWEKYQGNPVMDCGPFGSWEDMAVIPSHVLVQGSIYHMWYDGFDGAVFRVGHATSTDKGMTWTKDSLNPVLTANLPWEGTSLLGVSVIYVGGRYNVWYTAGNTNGVWRIGFATSPDGKTSWSKAMNPVLSSAAVGPWAGYRVELPTILATDSPEGFKMWFDGVADITLFAQIGYATGSSETTWTTSGTGPIINYGGPGSWDNFQLLSPKVIHNGQSYEMWYQGVSAGADFTKGKVGYAKATNETTWTRNPDPVLLPGSSGSWDDVGVMPGAVIFDGSKYHMWYAGYDGSKYRIGYATSDVVPSTGDAPHQIPASFVLEQNFPNPFNPATTIRYSTPRRSHVTLAVFNVLGQEVAELINGHIEAGSHEVQFNAHGLASGLYLYRMKAGDFVRTLKLHVLK